MTEEMNEEMSYGDCIDAFDELLEDAQRMPSGDDRAVVKAKISDIRDLIIKADIAIAENRTAEQYIERMRGIFKQQ